MKTKQMRRHHLKRLKKSRYKRFWNNLSQHDKEWWASQNKKILDTHIGIMTTTPCRCSCLICGNPRKYFKKITKQEILSLIKFKEEI